MKGNTLEKMLPLKPNNYLLFDKINLISLRKFEKKKKSIKAD